MTKPNTPGRSHAERDDTVGQALRSLDVGTSRAGFWDDVKSDLAEVHTSDMPEPADTPDGLAPNWISDESTTGVATINGRRTARSSRWANRPWILVAAAAAVLLLVGLVFVARPNGDDTTRIDVANPDIDPVTPEPGDPTTTATSDAEAPTPATTGGVAGGDQPADSGAAPAAVDYSRTPTAVDLPDGSLVVAGAPRTGLVVVNWPVPGGGSGGCEVAQGGYALLPVLSSGQAVPDRLANYGSQHVFSEAASGMGLLSDRCGDQSFLSRISESGEVVNVGWVRVPDGQQMLDHPAVWSPDESRFHLHTTSEEGGVSLLTYVVPAAGDFVTLEPIDSVALSPAEPRRLLAELRDSVRVEASAGDITVGGIAIGSYPEGEGPAGILARRSQDGTHVAIGTVGVLTIADANGVVARFDSGEARVLALDWSPTGQLLFSTSGERQGVRAYSPGAPDGDAFSEVAATQGTTWFDLEVADNGTVVALSGFGDGQRAMILTFPGDHRVPALDPDERLVRLGPPAETVGDQPLSLRGMGAIEAGMTVSQAETAIGGTLVYLGGLDGCGYAVVAGDPTSPRFMVITYQEGGENRSFAEGTIERIELGPEHQTLSGIRIGSTEEEIRSAYGERVEVTPHNYTFDQGGEYHTFVPVDAADAEYRLVMETLDDRVTQVRSGLLPAVEFVEGCA